MTVQALWDDARGTGHTPVEYDAWGAAVTTAADAVDGDEAVGPFRSGRYWRQPTGLGTVGTGAPPAINYLYAIPFYTPVPAVLDALGFFVNDVSAATCEFRLAVLSALDGFLYETLDQAAIGTDTSGLKTWTLTTPLTVQGWFFVAAGAQGSGTMPTTRRATPALHWAYRNATNYDFESTVPQSYRTSGVTSGELAQFPSFAWGGNGPVPWIEAALEPVT